MKIMGMTDGPYWLSWWCYYTIVNLFISSGVVLILSINVFKTESLPVFWLIVFLYGQSLFGYIIVCQSIFTMPRAAAITTTIIYYGLAIFYIAVDKVDTLPEHKAIVCLFIP